MRKMLALAAIVLLSATTGLALAHDDGHGYRRSRTAQRISAAEMRKQIDDLGYVVRRLKSDDGHYRAFIVDRDTGGTVKALFDATTGELLRARQVL